MKGITTLILTALLLSPFPVRAGLLDLVKDKVKGKAEETEAVSVHALQADWQFRLFEPSPKWSRTCFS